MKVICHTKGDPGEYLIVASGSEMTVLEDALYRRNILFENQDGPHISPHRQKLIKMLDAVRRPFVADRE